MKIGKKGEGKVEFFKNMEYFKEKYREGYVVTSILYRKAQEEINIQMSYQTFRRYVKKYLELENK